MWKESLPERGNRRCKGSKAGSCCIGSRGKIKKEKEEEKDKETAEKEMEERSKKPGWLEQREKG